MTSLRREEALGLVLALVAHVLLLAVLVLRPASPPPLPPERMEVTISDLIGKQATSPEPQASAQADIAPTLGEASPQPAPVPKPEPKPVPKPEPKPVPKPEPKKPEPKKPEVRPVPDPIARAIASAQQAAAPKKPVGGSRVGADFLRGMTSANTTGKSTTAPGLVAGPEVRASLVGAISRQLKPHWVAPQGADADQLVTILAFDLNRDGTLVGAPRVVSQSGITDSNRPQAARHAEQAVRAVELAAPFQLPPEYYDIWKHIPSARFDRKLSQ